MTSLDSFFAALADRTRLRLINLMACGEICVCYFVAVLGESQPKISRHLAYLRRAGVVKARRDGKWIHYGLAEPADPVSARMLAALVEELRDDDSFQADVAALASACCAPQLDATLREAPKPAMAGA
ncbi:MAG: metalloregulator ArsR/SmtB family transcription factor [Thermoanaerobaculia bacterium]